MVMSQVTEAGLTLALCKTGVVDCYAADTHFSITARHDT